jgi:hypothetical protein
VWPDCFGLLACWRRDGLYGLEKYIESYALVFLFWSSFQTWATRYGKIYEDVHLLHGVLDATGGLHHAAAIARRAASRAGQRDQHKLADAP